MDNTVTPSWIKSKDHAASYTNSESAAVMSRREKCVSRKTNMDNTVTPSWIKNKDHAASSSNSESADVLTILP